MESIFKVIKNEKEYNKALTYAKKLIDLSPDLETKESEELELLVLIIKNYEDEHYPIDNPDPIEAIKFRMEQQGLSQRDLIPIIGSRVKVSEVLSRKRPLTLKMIRSLNNVLEIPAGVLIKEKNANLTEVFSNIDFEKGFPILEMLERNIFDKRYQKISEIKEHAEELIRPLVEYVFNHQKTNQIEFKYKQNIRKGSEIDKNSLIIWKYLVIKKTENKLNETYNNDKLNNGFFKKLIELSSLPNGPKMSKEYLENFGIYLIIEKHFKKTHLDGASFIIRDNPVIALTLRHDRVDNFWFVLLHELAHIKLHLNSSENLEFIDDLDIKDNNEQEVEADSYASDKIINNDMWEDIKNALIKNRMNINYYSNKINIHPALIAGRFRKELNNYKIFSKMITESKVRHLFF